MALPPQSPSVGHAQVPTSITSSGLNTQVNHVGNTHTITGGTRPGDGPNLFHSFGDFSVGGGGIANFLNNSGLPTSNILGRVTGGNISNIYGTIQTTGFGNANLFLMNPSGIVLGPGASLNVGGAVSFTTAQYIRLSDGLFNSANFYANPANDGLANSILSIDPSAFEFVSGSPAGYGFLTAPDSNATITVRGSNLLVPSGQSISLVGGKVVIEGGAKLMAPGGSIKLASAASPGEFDATTIRSLPNVDGTTFASSGSLSLASGSSIDVHGSSTVFIKDGKLVLSVNDATLNTLENALESSAPQDTMVLAPGSSILTVNTGTEPGADLHATVGNFQMDHSALGSLTFGSGKGGTIQLQTNSLTMDNGATIQTRTQTGGGAGGDVVLNVGQARLMGGSSIKSLTQNSTPGSGQGGNITFQGRTDANLGAATSVSLSGGSLLSSETSAGSSSDGGSITIRTGSLTMDGVGTAITSTANDVGAGGNIVLEVQQAHLLDGATIMTLTTSGDPSAAAAPSFTLRGLRGDLSRADSVLLAGSGSGIVSDTTGQGRTGDVVLQATSIALTNAAVIQAGTPATSGAGGNVKLVADSVAMSGESLISSQAAISNAGTVAITANKFTMDNASITTQSVSSVGEARAGDITLNVGSVSLSNRATINSNTTGTGRAGDISIQSSTVNLTNGSVISSSSTGTGTGNAGSITIGGPTLPAGTVTITDSSVLTTSESVGQGGSITVNAASLALKNATISASVKNVPTNEIPSVGTANIALSAESITMSGSHITAESLGTRNAGNILINRPNAPGTHFEMLNSQINTSAKIADGGNIAIYTTNMLRLTDSTITSSVGNDTIRTTQGGNITIDPDFVILKGSEIRANAFAGTGGAIDITSGLFLADAFSLVDASSTLGVSGTVQINSPINNLSSVVARLPESLLEVQALLRASCAARLSEGATSSFVERGRDGIPVGPDALLASPYLPLTASTPEPRQPGASIGLLGIHSRRLFGRQMPSSVTFFSDHTTCSP